MADTHNQAEVKRRFPVTSGLLLTDKHEGRVSNLVREGITIVPLRKKIGIG